MKTEQLKEWGLTDEQIKLVFKENGKDIEAEKVKVTDVTAKLEEAKAKITEYETKISELQSASGNAEKFKTELDALKQKIADEKAAAEQAAKEAKENEEFQNRFNSVVGENKWRDELTQNAVFAEFKKALSDDANKGKGDKDILESLTKDKNYWDNPNKPKDMKSMGRVDFSKVTREQFGKMSYKERIELYNGNKELYDSLSAE